LERFSACVDDCLKPSQIAKKNSHLAQFSTAGDESSLAMIQTRETCLKEIDAGITGACYLAEWSMPPGCTGQEYWGYANPSLGLTVQLDALKLASSKDSFNRQHLNLWVSARGAWIDSADYEKLVTDLPMPEGGILACDASTDQNRFVGVRAVVANDVVELKVEFIVDSMTEMWLEVERVMGDPNVQMLIGPTYEISCAETFGSTDDDSWTERTSQILRFGESDDCRKEDTSPRRKNFG
jgi:hypothetical protein